MPETITALLRLARAGGHGVEGHTDMVRLQALRMVAGVEVFTEAVWMAGKEQLASLLANVIDSEGKGWGGCSPAHRPSMPAPALGCR